MKHIGLEIKRIVDEKGLKRRDLAHHLDMTEANVSKIYNKSSIDVLLLERISQFLGISIASFLDEQPMAGQQVHAVGDQSIAIAANGKKNFFSRNKVGDRHAETAGEVNILNEKVKHLEQLLEEKERLLEEKERLIKVLMEKR